MGPSYRPFIISATGTDLPFPKDVILGPVWLAIAAPPLERAGCSPSVSWLVLSEAMMTRACLSLRRLV